MTACGLVPGLQQERLEGLLVEIEHLEEIVGLAIPMRERFQAVEALEEGQQRRELIGRVAYVAGTRPRRDHQERHSWAEPEVVDAGRDDVVVEAPEVVPRDEGRPT